MQPKKSSLSTLSNEALCKLRDDVAALLKSRAGDLQRELNRLNGAHSGAPNGPVNSPNGQRKKIAPKYRGPNGDTWGGRGKRPRWLTGALNEGKKLEDFLIVVQ
jgi:DNA-binding protein H-NS